MSSTVFHLKGTQVLEDVMKVDYMGAVNIVFAALPELRKAKGHIGVVSSVYAKLPSKGVTGYAAAKHALHGFFDSLRLEERRNKINITMVCPGFINTDIHKNSLNGEGKSVGSVKPSTIFKLTEVSVGQAASTTLTAIAGNQTHVYFPFLANVAVFVRSICPSLDKVIFG